MSGEMKTGIGFNFIKCLIWDKGNKIMGQYYMNQFEYIIFLRKGKGVKINHVERLILFLYLIRKQKMRTERIYTILKNL